MLAGRARVQRRRAGLAALGTAALLLGLASPPAASASDSRGEHRLTVMTRNLYLGSSLTPALTATDTPSFLGAVARIYGTAQFTSFPTRAGAIADEVAATGPTSWGCRR